MRSRQTRASRAFLAAVVPLVAAAAIVSSPAGAQVSDPKLGIDHAQSQLDWCRNLRQFDTRTAADRAWADTCIRLAEREVARLTPPSSPPASTTPAVPTTTAPPTTTLPPPTTPPPTSTSPPAVGWPNATNTGVPAGVQLRNCGGAQTVTVDGAVIDGCLITGILRIRADNVTVRNSKIQGGMIDTGDNLIRNALIHDVEIDGLRADGTYPFGWNVGAIDYSDYTAIRVNAHGTGFGMHMGSRTRVIDSYLHDWTYTSVPTPAHQDGIISNGGRDLQIVGNNIECDDREGCSAALGLFGDWAPGIQDVLVQGNLLNTREGYCTHAGSDNKKPYPDGSNIRFLNNTFGKKWNPRCGNYGPVTSWENARGNVWSGNVWVDGGTVNP